MIVLENQPQSDTIIELESTLTNLKNSTLDSCSNRLNMKSHLNEIKSQRQLELDKRDEVEDVNVYKRKIEKSTEKIIEH